MRPTYNTMNDETDFALCEELIEADLSELLATPRPSAAKRKRDLEVTIGTFEDSLIEALYK